MVFYVASGLPNRERASQMVEWLKTQGHTPAYDWTKHGDVRSQGEERMAEVAQNESSAVMRAELVIIMLPGGQGTHTELGAALATCGNKRIIMWSESGKELGGGPDTCVFYHHPAIERVSGSADELKALLSRELTV